MSRLVLLGGLALAALTVSVAAPASADQCRRDAYYGSNDGYSYGQQDDQYGYGYRSYRHHRDSGGSRWEGEGSWRDRRHGRFQSREGWGYRNRSNWGRGDRGAGSYGEDRNGGGYRDYRGRGPDE